MAAELTPPADTIEGAPHTLAAPLRRVTLVLKIADRPGTLELIGATFAHRGVSLIATVGCDGALDPDGNATLTLHFRATERRNETLKATLARLPRVISVREVPEASSQAIALVRVAPDAALPMSGASVANLIDDNGEPMYRLIGTPDAVEGAIAAWRSAGKLRSLSYGVLALTPLSDPTPEPPGDAPPSANTASVRTPVSPSPA